MKLKRKRDMFDVVGLIPRPLGRKHINEDVSKDTRRTFKTSSSNRYPTAYGGVVHSAYITYNLTFL